jgi:hypothetical protein
MNIASRSPSLFQELHLTCHNSSTSLDHLDAAATKELLHKGKGVSTSCTKCPHHSTLVVAFHCTWPLNLADTTHLTLHPTVHRFIRCWRLRGQNLSILIPTDHRIDSCAKTSLSWFRKSPDRLTVEPTKSEVVAVRWFSFPLLYLCYL